MYQWFMPRSLSIAENSIRLESHRHRQHTWLRKWTVFVYFVGWCGFFPADPSRLTVAWHTLMHVNVAGKEVNLALAFDREYTIQVVPVCCAMFIEFCVISFNSIRCGPDWYTFHSTIINLSGYVIKHCVSVSVRFVYTCSQTLCRPDIFVPSLHVVLGVIMMPVG